ncbi:hypothetical protein LB523_11980 [Mesorhizobium sp. ESP-6-4]|uniref:hypothetical protein n=1 Tax=Mesorhizobium sp. ESP-6-4 TaxID=2876624 RepID=UPI001CCBD457|nr:hypothetical protein [Mesorhizobium sp. ESP-6-4]MBZ9659764.1 hypothetical protein [Mesorhizobium sp. ESP-6-4]
MKTTYHFDPGAMRTRFQHLRADRDRIALSDVEPLRKQMDDIIASIRELEAELKPIDAAYREKRQALVPIDKEMAIISRALKGETAPIAEA